MIYDYDGYLSDLAEEYNTSCAPEVVASHLEYEGEGEYSTSNIYNCENCDNQKCNYWKYYNEEEGRLL